MLIPAWPDKNGRLIPVNQMSESHIHACIAKIRRSRRGWRKEWLERLELELLIRRIAEQ